jgi:protein deglycase
VSKVLLLIFPGFSEFEITVATAVLQSRYEIVTVALRTAPVISETGLQVIPHLTVEQIDPAEYAALIVPGAVDMSPVMDAAPVLDLVRAMDRREKLLAAICAGGIVLAKAGALAGRPYTVTLYRRFREMLGCFDEAHFRYEPLVESGHVLTAQGFAFVDFGLRIGERLDALRDPAAVRAFYRGEGDIRWEG